MNGIDISNLNGSANLSAVKNAGYGFVISKITEGHTFVDSYGQANVSSTKSLGMYAGGYHFARFTDVAGAQQEAAFFKQQCPSNVDFVVLDFEQQCSGDMTEACLAFLDNVSSIAPAMIYCNPNYINLYLNSKITKYPLWIAHYGVSSPNMPIWGKCALWQYSEHGRVTGVNGDVDMNVAGDDFNKLIAPKYNQPNNYCKTRTTPILPYPFVSKGHIEFKPAPDNSSPTNGIREAGFSVNVYGKDGAYFSVTPNAKQMAPIAALNGTKSCDIQQVVQVISWNGAKCYENPDDSSLYNGTVPRLKYLPVYIDVDGYYLVNGMLANLQWVNNNADLQKVFPNNFSRMINKDTKPLFTAFAAKDNMNILSMPVAQGRAVGDLKKDEVFDVYGKFGEYYLISNIENKFVHIPDVYNTKPLSVIKQVTIVNADGGFCRENPCNKDKTNGIAPVGKVIPVYTECNGYYLVNGNNLNLQWMSTQDVEDVKA